jgi:hypothetical protein
MCDISTEEGKRKNGVGGGSSKGDVEATGIIVKPYTHVCAGTRIYCGTFDRGWHVYTYIYIFK